MKEMDLKVEIEKGTLYWITGLSGAGKTTIGNKLYYYLRKKKPNIIITDGDKIREKIYQNTDTSEHGRRELTYLHLRLIKFLTEQGIDVIYTGIALKNEFHEWNRANIDNYIEIFIEVPFEVLLERDSKGLYKRAYNHEIKNVYGVDIEYEVPKNPEMIIVNDGKETPEQILDRIIKKFSL